ncbi:hypothetical protein K445DRAFT_130867 [Daldinia sp. EC12]|nr:hypothetical protein K445DRAFT_130867 [Daldinia sp. EC12]
MRLSRLVRSVPGPKLFSSMDLQNGSKILVQRHGSAAHAPLYFPAFLDFCIRHFFFSIRMLKKLQPVEIGTIQYVTCVSATLYDVRSTCTYQDDCPLHCHCHIHIHIHFHIHFHIPLVLLLLFSLLLFLFRFFIFPLLLILLLLLLLFLFLLLLFFLSYPSYIIKSIYPPPHNKNNSYCPVAEKDTRDTLYRTSFPCRIYLGLYSADFTLSRPKLLG